MKRTMGLAILLLLQFLCPGSVEPSPAKDLDSVDAGQLITFEVELDPTPQFPGGRIRLMVGPDPSFRDSEPNPRFGDYCGEDLCRTTYAETIPNQPVYRLCIRIPGDAPTAVWRAYLDFALPNGNYREIGHDKKVRFQVKAHHYDGVPKKVRRFELVR